MKKTKFIVLVAMSVALLIAVQMALSMISGVELVTVILLCLCFCYGARTGLAIATTFSLLRCFFFGFQINVILLYLVYYNLFALFFGLLGKRCSENVTWLQMGIVTFSAVIFTALFTLLDDVITPLIYSFHWNATKVYFLQSLTAMVPQMVCAGVSVLVLFAPLTRVIRKINFQ